MKAGLLYFNIVFLHHDAGNFSDIQIFLLLASINLKKILAVKELF